MSVEPEQGLTKETVYDGKLFKVVRETVKIANGSTRPRELVIHPGAVAAKVIMGRDVQMTLEREQWLPFSLPVEGMEESQVIITYHPSYIMRQQGEALERIRGQALADFTVVAARLASL